jgi:cytochrome c553
MARHLLALLFTTALVGCVGDVSTLPPPDDEPETAPTARERFDRDVNQVVETACASCHNNPGTASATPKFTGAAGLTDNYTSLEANGSLTGGWKAANARLITKGVHADGGARAFTAAEIGKITAWLDAEDAERPDGPPDPSAATTPARRPGEVRRLRDRGGLQRRQRRPVGQQGHHRGQLLLVSLVRPRGPVRQHRLERHVQRVAARGVHAGLLHHRDRQRLAVPRPRQHRQAVLAAQHQRSPGYACGTNDDAAKALIQFVQLTNDKLVNCTATPGFATGPLPF